MCKCVYVCVINTSVCVSCHFSLALFSFFSVACLFSIEKEKESVVDLVGEEVGRSWGKGNYDQNKLCGEKKTIFTRKRKK